MIEVWKDIPNYDGVYQVSNFGNIRSTDRTQVQQNCHKGYSTRSLKWHPLTPINNGKGYLYISLSKYGLKKNHYIHRLVAELFCEKSEENLVVNHKDKNKKNNRADNLEWITQKENVRYSADEMKKPKSHTKPTNTGVKYLSKQLQHGNVRYRVYIRQRGICKMFKTKEDALSFLEGVMKDGV